MSRGRTLWRKHGVILIAMAACAMIMVGFASLIAYSGVTVRQLALEHETLLIDRVVERKTEKLKHDLAAIAIWNQTYDNIQNSPNSRWVDLNVGRYLNTYAGHDLTVVFDVKDRPFYALLHGVQTPPAQMADILRAAAPLVRQVRKRESAKIAATPTALGFARAVAAASPMKVGDQVYFVAASTVVPEEGYKGKTSARGAIVLSAVEAGPAFLTMLTTDYNVREPRFAAPGPRQDAWVDLRGPNGESLGAVTWTPKRPGFEAMKRVKWIILAVTAMIVVTLALLARGMSRLILQLRQAREEALAASRAKSEFLANISHEIRTPLNGVLGMAQAMSADSLSAEQRQRLAVVQESGGALLALLNDVLDISKIQAGKLEIDIETFDLPDLCRSVCGAFQGLAAAKDVGLEFSVETGERRLWRGDALRIRQVLSNLISNAVKFTDRGVVRLLVTPTADGLAFSVLDTGIGLNEDQIGRLFQKFSQVDASMTRRHGGSGLGLAISHDLVRLMGGRLQVTSHPGEGSTFAFTLPMASIAHGRPTAVLPGLWEPAPPPQRALPALRILAAEDNPTNQLVLRALLQPLEVDLQVVANGVEAVQAFEAGAFDLVLMDIQMPLMSGVEAAKLIRSREAASGRPRTPIIALSANVMTHHLAEYSAAGMDAHVGKPIEIEKLYKMLDRVARGAALEFQLAG